MRRPLLLLVVCLGAGAPPVAIAQVQGQGQGCELLPGAREANQVAMGDGREMFFISGPAEFVCPDGTTIKADSAVGVRNSGELELIGNVYYADSVKTLTADWARYLRTEGRLYARDNVVLTDRDAGSVVRGPELEYLREGPRRPESHAILRGRPHAVLHGRNEEAAEVDSASAPLEIDADRMEMLGERLFLAIGTVELTRGETRGYGREGEFDQSGERMVLTGDARVEGEEFNLVGDRIEAFLEAERLREVVAEREAVLTAEDLRVDAPLLHVFLVEGEVDRLVAVRSATGDTPGAQPRAVAQDFLLVADSIDALAPGQQLDRLIAIGDAYGEKAVDSLDVELPAVIAHDWLRGDTITAYFIPEPVPPGETVADTAVAMDSTVVADSTPSSTPDRPRTRAALDRLVAIGPEGRARSLYRIREEGQDPAQPSINYLVANRIVLVMKNGEVQNVEADGPIDGMHLQPGGRTDGGRPPRDGSAVGPDSMPRER